MATVSKTPTNCNLTESERRILADRVTRYGLTSVARSAGITREATACALAGLKLRRGTLVLIRSAPDLLQAPSNPPRPAA